MKNHIGKGFFLSSWIQTWKCSITACHNAVKVDFVITSCKTDSKKNFQRKIFKEKFSKKNLEMQKFLRGETREFTRELKYASNLSHGQGIPRN